MSNAERLRANDERFGREAKLASMSRAEQISELRSQIADAQNTIERLEREQAEEDNRNVSVIGDPEKGGLIRDNTGVDGEAPEGAPQPAQTYSDEKYWTVPKLQEEIDSRNVDRKAAGLVAISKSGKRAELVERLLKDDEELEQEG
jgi:hypothetical protein